MKFKKITFMLVLVLCISSLSSVFAAETENNSIKLYSYQPRWVNVISIHTYVEETNSGLDAYAIIIPNNDEKVKGTLYLQKYKNGN